MVGEHAVHLHRRNVRPAGLDDVVQPAFPDTPLRRVGDPVEDVGEGVVFLCGPRSRYVAGTTLMLDGGRSYLR
jgi:NAD(P)-dependent dehydrogenase (short-subunit alcohol dehydrogenase family)